MSTCHRHGRSAGIGYELAKCCAKQDFDRLVVDQLAIRDAELPCTRRDS
jgi:hypothetical protein